MAYCDIEDGGARHLAQALELNNTLDSLNLRRTGLTAASGLHFASMLERNGTLKSLALGTVCLMREVPLLTTQLDLQGLNFLGDAGARHLSTALARNAGLTLLNLDSNRVEHASALAAALQQNTTLTSLSLSNNEIADADAFAAMLDHNSALTFLSFRASQLAVDATRALAGTALRFSLYANSAKSRH